MRLPAIAVAAIALAASAAWSPSLAQPLLARPLPAQPAADAAKLELARQLYDLSGGAQAVKDHLQSMFSAANKIVAANLPPDQGRLSAAINRDMVDEMSKLAPDMIDNGAHAYADNLSEQELKDYVAWLSSDSGKAVLRKLPAIRQEMLAREMPALSALFPQLLTHVQDRVCEELACTARQRQVVATALAKALPTRGS